MATAVPTRTTYQAKIIKPDGYPLEASSVNFKFSIMDSPGTCILYSETYSGVNMSSTLGLISFSLGSGLKTYPVSATTLAQVFSNITPNMACDASGVPTTYTPTSSDGRKIVMQFNDGGGWQTLPAMMINAVPYAMYANDAERFQGLAPSDFVQVSTIPTCAASEALRYTGASFICIAAGGNGSVTSGSVTTAFGYTPADSAVVTSVSSTVFSVSSTVANLSSSFTSLSNSVAASFAAIAGSGISTFNGSTSATQSLANGNAGTAPAFVTAAGIHTLNIPYASVGTTTAGLISNSDYSLFSTVISKITSSAAAIAQVLGYTPADQAAVTTLSSTVGSVSSAANAAQITANSVSSTVNSLSSTVAGKITSSAASVAQVLGYVPAASGSMVSSQWTTSGSTINYSGNVGIGTTNPQYKLAVSGTSHLSGRVMIGNTPFPNSSYDFGPMVGNGTFYSPFVIQETITDFSNPTTLGNMNVTLLNAASDSSVLSAGRLNLIQNTASSTANHSTIIGDYTVAENEGAGNILQLIGSYPLAMNNGSGNINRVVALHAQGYNVNGQVNDLVGGFFGAVNLAGSVTNSYKIFVDSAVGAGVTNNYGLYISDQSTVASSQTYNIFSAGLTTNNHFAGSVGIGELLPRARLHVGAGTNMFPMFKLTSSTLTTSPQSGSVEYNGFNFYITDGTNTRRTIATVATPGTYDSASNISNTGNISLTPTGSVIVSSTTASTNSQTGSLVVRGGLGVAGNLFSSGTIITSSNIQGASITATDGVATNIVQGTPNLLLNPGGGNVGIRNSNPQGILEIGTNSASANGFRFVSGNDQSSMRFVADSTANWIQSGLDFSNDSKKDLKFSSNNGVSTWMTLQASTGNVGIGTTAPQNVLNIATSGVTSAGLQVGLNSDSFFSFLGPNQLMFNRSNISYIDQRVSGGSLMFRTTAVTPADTQVMTLTTSGNVGIGTSAPVAKLDVRSVVGAGDNSFRFNDGFSNQTPTLAVLNNNANGRAFGMLAGTNSAGIYFDSGGNFTIGSTSKTTIASGTLGIDAIQYTFTSSTRLGIGTTTPAGSLHIVAAVSQSNAPGQGIFLGRSLGEDHQIQITEHNGIPHLDFSRDVSRDFDARIASYGNSMLSLGTSSGTQLLNLVNSNVGIGTMTPSAKLHVKGTFLSDSDSTNGILGQISVAGRNSAAALPNYTQWSIYNMNEYGPSKGLSFYEYYDADSNGVLCNGGDTCASRMIIAQGGNVGIGTQTPTTALQVNGIISPSIDNNSSLGTGALRFTAVYAVNGAIQTSDARQKKNITNSDLGLDFINKLRPVSYNWISGEDKSVHYGLIAQETEKIVNESRGVASNEPTPIVDYDKESGRYGLRYTELISPIIKAIQEIYHKLMGHDEKLEALERKVASLEAENKAKDEKNKELEQRLQNIEKALQENK